MPFNLAYLVRRKEDIRGFTYGPVPSTIPQPPDTRTVRSPVFSRLWAISSLVAILAQPFINLNTSTLAAPAAPAEKPFYQADYPNPRGPVFPIALRTHLDPTRQQLIGQDAFPFRQRDWQVPKGYAPRQDFIRAAQVQLLQPFGQKDWPNPRGPTITVRGVTQNAIREVAAVTPPFYQTQWPNPRGPTRHLPIHQLRLPAEEEVEAAPVSLDWYQQPSEPVRLRANAITAGETRTIRRVEIAPTNWQAVYPDFIWRKPPVSHLAPWHFWWSEPIAAVAADDSVMRGSVFTRFPRLAARQDFVRGFMPPEVVVVQAPFSQSQWLNPRGAVQARQDFIRSAQVQLLQPFAQKDWPTSRGYGPRQDFVRSSQIHLFGQDAFPFRERDWPLPKGYTRHPDFIRSAQVHLLQPFAQRDWPNPKGHAPRQDFIRASQIQLIGQDAFPFRQRDWPVPKGYPGRQDFIRAAQIHLFGQDALPFRLLDWPLPLGYPLPSRQNFFIDFIQIVAPGGTPEFDTSWTAIYPNFINSRPPTYHLGPPTVWYPITGPDVEPPVVGRPKRRLLTVLKVGF